MSKETKRLVNVVVDVINQEASRVHERRSQGAWVEEEELLIYNIGKALAQFGAWNCVKCGGWYNAGPVCEACGSSKEDSINA